VAQAMSKNLIKVSVSKSGTFFFITFPDHPNLFSQATHLREIETMAVDLIHCALDIPLSAIEVDISYPTDLVLTEK
jgi:hypothetical protein